jgi:hypothetical protein
MHSLGIKHCEVSHSVHSCILITLQYSNQMHIICLLGMVQQDEQGQFRRDLVKNIYSKYIMCIWLEY